MTNGIYCYIDKKNNSIIYIGKDNHIDKNKRHKQHLQKSNYNNQQINRVLQNNKKKYQYKILKSGNFSQNLLNVLEILYIKRYNPIFNFTIGGEGTLGYKFTSEQKNNISKNNAKHWKGKKFSKNHVEKMIKNHSRFWKGKKFSKEHEVKISKALNTTGYYRVSKTKDKRCKQGFKYRYTYKDKKSGKRKEIVSVNIKRLEKKVKEKGLPWEKFL